MIVLADSDVLIDYLNGRGKTRVIEAIVDQRVVASAISRFEVLRGAVDQHSRSRALELFDNMPQLPLDIDAVDHAVAVHLHLRRLGMALEARDTLIAGTAIANGLPLFTRNRKHFERIPGLELEEV